MVQPSPLQDQTLAASSLSMGDRLLETLFTYSAQGLLLIGVSATRPPQYQVISANSIGQQLLGNHFSVASLF
ncbi:hypothetical protein [Thermosynechococcus sp. M98_K2018_005]|nr:hypothetical protein [Thermosynechococcus sp. M98_K2018_005]